MDVDALLEELTPQQLVEWRAARQLVPLEDGWRQAGTIAASAHNDFERYLAGKAGKRYVPKERLAAPGDYIPRPRRPAPVINEASIAAHQAAIAASYAAP